MAKVVCPECRTRLRIPFLARASKVRCPGCGHVVAKDVARRLAKLMDQGKPRLSHRTRVALSAAAGGVLLLGTAAFVVTLRYAGGRGEAQEPAEAVGPARPGSLKPSAAEGALSPEQIFAAASPAVVRVFVTGRSFDSCRLGSGFFVRPEGMLITAYHGLRDAAFACVKLADETVFPVTGLLGGGPEADLALLKVACEGQPFLRIAPDTQLRVGMRVYALGSPGGLTNSLSEGLVSGLRGSPGGLSRIQLTAAISPGSSGGPLLTERAEVVGIVSASYRKGQLLNFAVPATKAAALLEAARLLPRPLPERPGALAPADARKMTQAWVAYVGEDWRKAAALLEDVRQRYPEDLDLTLAKGQVYLAGEQPFPALTEFRNAAQRRPQCSRAHVGIGRAHFIACQWPQAAEAFRKAIDMGADSPRVYLYAGMAFREARRYPEAVRVLRTAIDKQPGSTVSLRARALLETIPSKFK